MKQWYNELNFNRGEQQFKAGLALVQANLGELLCLPQLLNPREQLFYNTLQYEKRQTSYLLGRVAAKKALMELWGITEPASVCIDSGIFRQPVVQCPGVHNTQVSISHCGNIGVCIAFPEAHPAGIDMEEIRHSSLPVLEKQMTGDEKKVLENAAMENIQGATILWTVKEALSKILRTGMMVDYRLLEVNLLARENSLYLSTFTAFRQYKGISAVFGNYVLTLVLPQHTQVVFAPLFEVFNQIA